MFRTNRDSDPFGRENVFDGLRKVTPEREFIIRPEVPAHTSLTLFSALIRRNLIPTSAAAVDRLAALEVGGMDARFRICHDYALWLRMAHRWPIVRVCWSGAMLLAQLPLKCGYVPVNKAARAGPHTGWQQ